MERCIYYCLNACSSKQNVFRFLLGTRLCVKKHRGDSPSTALCYTGLNTFNGFSDSQVRNETANQAQAESCRGRDGVEDSAGYSDLLLGQDWEFVCKLPYSALLGYGNVKGKSSSPVLHLSCKWQTRRAAAVIKP